MAAFNLTGQGMQCNAEVVLFTPPSIFIGKGWYNKSIQRTEGKFFQWVMDGCSYWSV